MGLRARILRLVSLEYGGPRKRNVLEALARSDKQRRQFPQIFDQLIDRGELVMVGAKRGARYGLPRRPRA